MSSSRLIDHLIEQFMKFPGVGRRSAERMVFWILNNPKDQAQAIADGIVRLKDGLGFCKVCNNLSEAEQCSICTDPGRNQTIICIVENPKDLLAIERTGTYKGQYHVLLGALSPAEGRGPEELKIHTLINRVKAKNIREVVIATDPDTEGEMTALHIINELKSTDVKISRIGLGIPVGSSVEYADLSTLTMALASRREIRE